MCDGISGTHVWSEHAEPCAFGVLPSAQSEEVIVNVVSCGA